MKIEGSASEKKLTECPSQEEKEVRPVRRILKRGVQSIASWPLGHGEGEGAGLREAFTLWMI